MENVIGKKKCSFKNHFQPNLIRWVAIQFKYVQVLKEDSFFILVCQISFYLMFFTVFIFILTSLYVVMKCQFLMAFVYCVCKVYLTWLTCYKFNMSILVFFRTVF